MKLLKQLIEFLKQRSGGTEQDTEYNGVLSYAGEWHALIIGLAAGIVAIYTHQPMVAIGVMGVALGLKGVGKLAGPLKGQYVVEEITSEPWYACGGVLVGWVVAAVYTGAGILPVGF
jgi:hypothetical protein